MSQQSFEICLWISYLRFRSPLWRSYFSEELEKEFEVFLPPVSSRRQDGSNPWNIKERRRLVIFVNLWQYYFLNLINLKIIKKRGLRDLRNNDLVCVKVTIDHFPIPSIRERQCSITRTEAKYSSFFNVFCDIWNSTSLLWTVLVIYHLIKNIQNSFQGWNNELFTKKYERTELYWNITSYNYYDVFEI